MFSHVTAKFKYLLVAIVLLFSISASAQNNYHNLIFTIDSLIEVGLPKSALKQVEALDIMARKENNAPQLVRAAIYRTKFQTYLQDDALVNIINTLNADIDRSVFPVRPVLQSFLADMYWKYYEQNRYQFIKRSRLEKPDIDFRKWDVYTLVQQTTRLYQLSLKDTEQLQNTPVDVLDGILEGDKRTRYLRPTLYDLLLHRAFAYFLADEPDLVKPKLSFNINEPHFFSDNRAFANLTVKTTDTASTIYHGIKYLQQGLQFHLQKNNRQALADLDLQRLNFIHINSRLGGKDSLYIAALKRIAADESAGDFRADALYNIGNYYNDLDSLVTARSYLQQAEKAYRKSPGGINSFNLMRQIEVKELSATVEDVNSPNQPLLALLNYRNLKTANYKIYYLTDEQVALLNKMDQHEDQILPGKKTVAYLKKLKPVQDKLLNLPVATDYRVHSTEFKIDPLKTGTYVLMLKQAGDKDSLLQLNSFAVSNLAYFIRQTPNGKREIRVVNRQTGKLVSGAAVTITYKPNNYGKVKKKPTVYKGVTDANGAYLFNRDASNYTVALNYLNDKYHSNTDYDYYSSYNNAEKDSVISTYIFTDREIYRPGQTIYFKALQTRRVNGKSNIIPNTNVVVEFIGAGRKQIASVTLKTNEFGSAASSFIIPQIITGGYFELKTDNGMAGIRIEEYKRPTFKVNFEPITQNYKLNDSVTIKGKVQAFSGYGVSDAKIALHITRNASAALLDDADDKEENNIEEYKYTHRYLSYNENNGEVTTDTIKTDAQGQFEYKFLAAGVINNSAEQFYNFNIKADVTDDSNETQTATTDVSIGTKAIRVKVVLPAIAIAGNGIDASLGISNGNDQKQNGKATIRVYALTGPGVFFKTRLWSVPDKWMMSQSDYRTDFPHISYNYEGEYKNWQRLAKISELEIKVSKDSAGKLDFAKLLQSPAGVYAVVINARNENGDTLSVTRYINLVTEDASVQKTKDWVVPVNTTVKANQPAEFFVGVGEDCEALLETYDADKLLSSKLIRLRADKLQKISLAVPLTAKNSFAVQFMLINGNRRYNYYQRILFRDTTQQLDVKFLTMRDKLQPGEKEQWKLQISGSNNQQAAELLAGMYDASLDDIVRGTSWQQKFNYTPSLQNYYQWINTPPASVITTIAYGYYRRPYEYDRRNTDRDYESLNTLNYNYEDDNSIYSNYIDNIKEFKKNALSDKLIAAKYLKNTSKVNGGYDVIGRVVHYNVTGIKVSVSNTDINTVPNSLGYFKIRVPQKAVLVFSGKKWVTKRVLPVKGLKLIVKMKTVEEMRYEQESADPGVKSQKGDPDAEIRIDEPVGNSDVKQGVEERSFGYSYNAVKFPPPVVKNNKDVLKKFNTSGAINFKEIRIDIPPTIRKNFNETAFFYPQLRTNTKGEISFDFTIPESLTRWKFRAFAHNKELQAGYIEQEIVTQKKLMISANMPRFLREGDTLSISARGVNLSATALKGQAKLELINAVTLQSVNLFARSADATQKFELDTSATKAVTFKIIIPSGIEALTYRLTASAGNYTDGEENTVPVLPNRMLVTESMPMMVRSGQTKTFNFDKLINQISTTLKSKNLTLEYTKNPAWYAVQALPYMIEFPYECSEQVFSRFYANSFAAGIIERYPQIKQVFNRWKAANSRALVSNLEKNPELKSVLLEETPWLRDAANENEQKNRIALLFDLNKLSYEQGQSLDKLHKKQLPDGGFPWFAGDRADRYITQHILAGIGQLKKAAIPAANSTLDVIRTNALVYLNNKLKTEEADIKKYDKKYASRNLSPLEVHAWYARSYFKDTETDATLKEVEGNYVNRALKQWVGQNEYNKAMIALKLYRMGNKVVTTAIMKSLLETASQSDDLGMYWPANQQGYHWYQSLIETQCLLIELFTEVGGNEKSLEEMKIWLLRNKQTSNWKTTKATAAACYALLLKQGDWLSTDAKSEITIGGKSLSELKPDVKEEVGSGYIKTAWADESVKPALGKVEVKNNGKSISWGAMYWQYMEQLDKITPSHTDIQLERKYFILKQTNSGSVATVVDATHQPKTGDLLKVIVYLKAGRDFEYVQLKDMRPAGTEPVSTLSQYKYQDGLYYYQVTKDVATNFFISTLSKGNYVFEYQLRVAQPGNYAIGISTVQCMYAPEFNAHSEGARMSIKP